MFLCLAIVCENFVTFMDLTIYYETDIKLLDLFHQASNSLYSDREPEFYHHSRFCMIVTNCFSVRLVKPMSSWQTENKCPAGKTS